MSKFPDQPDLTDQVRAALDVLSKNDKGFLLMVESGRIDKYSHSLDWERAVFDTIMFDNAVKVAKDFAAARNNDTLIIVVPDHAHGVAIVGTYDDEPAGRDALAAWRLQPLPVPELPARRTPTAIPRASTFRVALPSCSLPIRTRATTRSRISTARTCRRSKASRRGRFVANEKNCALPGAVRRPGNLPFNINSGVHAADDVILTAMGPGAEVFRGHIENTRVFRAMATALGLRVGRIRV